MKNLARWYLDNALGGSVRARLFQVCGVIAVFALAVSLWLGRDFLFSSTLVLVVVIACLVAVLYIGLQKVTRRLRSRSPTALDSYDVSGIDHSVDFENGKVPDDYLDTLHLKDLFYHHDFWLSVVLGILGLGLVVAGPSTLFFMDTSGAFIATIETFALLCALLSLFLFYRRFWAWKHRPVTCKSRDGMLRVHQSPNRWLFLLGSAPDAYSLSDYVLFTPQQTFLETYIFRRSQTLELRLTSLADNENVLVLKNVKDVGKLIVIQEYREYLEKKGVDEGSNAVDELKELNIRMGRIEALLSTIAESLGANIPNENTSELPVIES